MRSRYSAYVLRLAPYLLQTWHPHTRPAQLDLPSGERWLGLSVSRHERLDAHHARVAFVARSKRVGVAGGRAHRMAELSRFERLDGRWYYVDGDLADGPGGGLPD
jgi:SEC-C motif-containing protein